MRLYSHAINRDVSNAPCHATLLMFHEYQRMAYKNNLFRNVSCKISKYHKYEHLRFTVHCTCKTRIFLSFIYSCSPREVIVRFIVKRRQTVGTSFQSSYVLCVLAVVLVFSVFSNILEHLFLSRQPCDGLR